MGGGFVALYVFAPEKFVTYALCDNGGIGRHGLLTVIVGISAFLDLTSMGALIAGVSNHSLPFALGFGYALTSTVGVVASLLSCVTFYKIGGLYRVADNDTEG